MSNNIEKPYCFRKYETGCRGEFTDDGCTVLRKCSHCPELYIEGPTERLVMREGHIVWVPERSLGTTEPLQMSDLSARMRKQNLVMATSMPKSPFDQVMAALKEGQPKLFQIQLEERIHEQRQQLRKLGQLYLDEKQKHHDLRKQYEDVVVQLSQTEMKRYDLERQLAQDRFHAQEAQPQLKICPSCGGKGYWKVRHEIYTHICEWCKGSGKVPQ